MNPITCPAVVRSVAAGRARLSGDPAADLILLVAFGTRHELIRLELHPNCLAYLVRHAVPVLDELGRTAEADAERRDAIRGAWPLVLPPADGEGNGEAHGPQGRRGG